MKLRWLRLALRELEEEAAYIARDDERTAALVVKRIFEAVSKLPSEPGMGHPGRIPGTRELVVRQTHYIVPYRVRGEEVQILRIFHTARKRPNYW
jgi:plasmid stabilization system protein ParE